MCWYERDEHASLVAFYDIETSFLPCPQIRQGQGIDGGRGGWVLERGGESFSNFFSEITTVVLNLFNPYDMQSELLTQVFRDYNRIELCLISIKCWYCSCAFCFKLI